MKVRFRRIWGFLRGVVVVVVQWGMGVDSSRLKTGSRRRNAIKEDLGAEEKKAAAAAADVRGNPIPILIFQLSMIRKYREKATAKSRNLPNFYRPVSSCFGPGFGLESKQQNFRKR